MPTVVDRGRDAQSPEVDLVPVFTGLFNYVVRGAKRIVQLSEDDLSTLRELWVMIPAADDKGKIEITETILEILFPTDHIGGTAEERRSDTKSANKVSSCREFVGRQIKQFRENKGLTQEELADAAGLPQSHISRLENGKHTPTHLTIEKIAKALGLHPSVIDIGYPESDMGYLESDE